MKLRVLILTVFALLTIASLQAIVIAQRSDAKSARAELLSRKQRFIVLLKDSAVGSMPAEVEVSAYGNYLAAVHGGDVKQVFSHAIHGYVSEMSSTEAAQIALDPNVLSVEEDRLMTLSSTEASAPWHLDRVDQRGLPLDGAYSYAQTASNVNIYIIDTGIRYTHVEFGGRADAVYDNVGDGWNGNDCNGHGTHVAGLAASASYGVAKQANVHSVRVVGCDGTAYISNLLGGIDWVTAHHVGPSVANISLQLGGASSTLENALANSVASGVTYTVAAGNNNMDACNFTPSRVPSAITVGASASNDSRASYSNIGPCVDVFAPGTALTSLSNANDTDARVLSGTSMAAPVVAGIAALYLSGHPSASPSEVWNSIKGSSGSGLLSGVDSTTPNLLVYSLLSSPARIKVRKAVASGGTTTSSVFNYSAVNLSSPAFSLTNNATYEDTNVNTATGLTTVKVTEGFSAGSVLTGISCSEVSTGLPAYNDSSVDLASRTAVIRAEPGEDITCTFTSQPLAPTAATVAISGRALSSTGNGIRGVRVSLLDLRTGRLSTAVSNAFGFYVFSDATAGSSYAVSVANSPRYAFTDRMRILNVNDAVSDVNFISDTR